MSHESHAFDHAVTLILKHEGGYVNDPQDPGGETNFGISKQSYPKEDIRKMTVARARAIYHRDYWMRVRGDELPLALATITFDMAVNAGVGTAIKLLQKTVRVHEDGVLGPATLAAARAFGGGAAADLSRHRIRHYASLPGWGRFGKAWTLRTLDTLLEVL